MSYVLYLHILRYKAFYAKAGSSKLDIHEASMHSLFPNILDRNSWTLKIISLRYAWTTAFVCYFFYDFIHVVFIKGCKSLLGLFLSSLYELWSIISYVIGVCLFLIWYVNFHLCMLHILLDHLLLCDKLFRLDMDYFKSQSFEMFRLTRRLFARPWHLGWWE